MTILIQARNTTATAQQVQVTDAQGNNLANVTISAQANVNLHTLEVNANAELHLICNGNNAEAATLNIVYPGNSNVIQDSDWVRQWRVEGTGTGVQLDLS